MTTHEKVKRKKENDANGPVSVAAVLKEGYTRKAGEKVSKPDLILIRHTFPLPNRFPGRPWLITIPWSAERNAFLGHRRSKKSIDTRFRTHVAAADRCWLAFVAVIGYAFRHAQRQAR